MSELLGITMGPISKGLHETSTNMSCGWYNPSMRESRRVQRPVAQAIEFGGDLSIPEGLPDRLIE